MELSSINKVSLVYVSSCSNTGSIRDDPYWTSGQEKIIFFLGAQTGDTNFLQSNGVFLC
jgi:hypothetical protein